MSKLLPQAHRGPLRRSRSLAVIVAANVLAVGVDALAPSPSGPALVLVRDHSRTGSRRGRSWRVATGLDVRGLRESPSDASLRATARSW